MNGCKTLTNPENLIVKYFCSKSLDYTLRPVLFHKGPALPENSKRAHFKQQTCRKFLITRDTLLSGRIPRNNFHTKLEYISRSPT